VLRVVVVSLILVLGGAVAACGGSSSAESGVVTGTGVQKTRTYDFSGFTSVRVTHGFSVVIQQGDAFAVSASVDENLVQYLRVEVQGDTLSIGLDPSVTYRLTDVSAEVTMPDLSSLEVAEAADVYAVGFEVAGDLSLLVSGAGQLNVEGMKAANASLEVAGGGRLGGELTVGGTWTMKASEAGKAIFSGAARSVDLTASGASEVSLKNLAAKTASVTLTGASSASVRASRTLDVALAQASTLDYYGSAELGRADVTGASQINHIQQ